MAHFNNPFDISKDGENIFEDGIRYHIRNSEQISEEVLNYLQNNYLMIPDYLSALGILEEVLKILGYNLNDLTIADEHELLSAISQEYLD
jgi:hypothetical protein